MSVREKDALKPGAARCEGPSYTDLLDAEKAATPPEFVREESYSFLGDADLPVERYIGKEFFAREVEKMWPRVWQMVCREEDIPNVGDTEVYELLDWSFLIVRSDTDTIRAYYNSCMHRGRKLRTSRGRVQKFKCPFHGFEFGLDGELQHIPCRWDFPHLNEGNMKLPEVRVETWGGFVFINMDENAPSLHEYLGIIPEHFTRWKLEDCYKIVHVTKVVPSNWKLTAEAFMESYHAVATHPQILPYSADANARYDFYGDNVNRNLTPMGVTSPHLYDNPPSEQEILDALVETSGRVTGEGADAERLKVPEGQTAREFMAAMNRELFASEDGYDYSDASDAELLDAFVYNVFPNFSPWGGFVPNIVYRWRPNGHDPDSTLMEVMFLKRAPKEGPRPKPCGMHFLTDEQAWSEAEELGALGPIFDQDMGNLPHVQTGMKASKKGAVSLANYQEIRIRHFHQTLDKYLES